MSISRRALFAQMLLAGLVSRLLTPEDADAETVTYTYDAQGRLTRAAYSNGVTVDYSYDAAGNRSQVVRAGGVAPPPPPATFTNNGQPIQITGTGPVNLRTLANAAGYDGARSANVTFQLANTVTITGAAGAPGGGIAIDSGIWPWGLYSTTVALQITGKVYGGGGQGGAGNGGAGGAGGDAVHCRLPMSILVNAGGQVKAGGGGGGGGGRGRQNQGGEWFFYGGGGGGGGAPNGPSGTGGSGDSGAGANGSAGSTSGGGAGGLGASAIGGDGGNGGNFGQSGIVGTSAYQAGGGGGAAGYAIRKNGNTVPITNNGTIVGTQA